MSRGALWHTSMGFQRVWAWLNKFWNAKSGDIAGFLSLSGLVWSVFNCAKMGYRNWELIFQMEVNPSECFWNTTLYESDWAMQNGLGIYFLIRIILELLGNFCGGDIIPPMCVGNCRVLGYLLFWNFRNILLTPRVLTRLESVLSIPFWMEEMGTLQMWVEYLDEEEWRDHSE